MKKLCALGFSLLMLQACAPAHTRVIQPLDTSYQSTLNIKDVSVSYGELSADKIVAQDEELVAEGEAKSEQDLLKYKPLKESMESVVTAYLEDHDSESGNQANVYIEVDNLKLANPIATILISDMDQMSGTVKVTDAKSSHLLTEFYVDVIQGSGGLLGLAIRGTGVREKLATQFAQYIGDELGFEKTSAQPKEVKAEPND